MDVAGIYNKAGENVQPAYRDASIIVYTPTGHMAVVYLPPPGRKPFADRLPRSKRRARPGRAPSVLRHLIVQPKTRTMFHYQMSAANPTAVGGWFMRNFEINGPR